MRHETLKTAHVHETALSVAFGALHSGPPVTLGRRPLVDNISGTEDGGGFSTNGAKISRWPGAMSNVLSRGASRTRMFEHMMLPTRSGSIPNANLYLTLGRPRELECGEPFTHE